MTNKEFEEIYLEREKELQEQCDQMVEDGELTQDEADFRFLMVRDEILMMMDEPDETTEHKGTLSEYDSEYWDDGNSFIEEEE